jgi:hypothetical protein
MLHVSTLVLDHHQAHDEYKLLLIELRLKTQFVVLSDILLCRLSLVYIIYPTYDTQQDAYYEEGWLYSWIDG